MIHVTVTVTVYPSVYRHEGYPVDVPMLTTCVCSSLREECVSLSNSLTSSRGCLATLRLVFAIGKCLPHLFIVHEY